MYLVLLCKNTDKFCPDMEWGVTAILQTYLDHSGVKHKSQLFGSRKKVTKTASILPKKNFNHFTEFHNLKSNFIKVITENFRNHFFENPLDYKCFFYITFKIKLLKIQRENPISSLWQLSQIPISFVWKVSLRGLWTIKNKPQSGSFHIPIVTDASSKWFINTKIWVKSAAKKWLVIQSAKSK